MKRQLRPLASATLTLAAVTLACLLPGAAAVGQELGQERSQEQAPAPIVDSSAAGDLGYSALQDDAPAPAPAANPADFYSVYEYGCRVGPIDDWCNCREPICFTDEWCDNPCDCGPGNMYLGAEPGEWLTNAMLCDVHGLREDTHSTALRFGWWSVGRNGNQTKTGEFQDLNSGPFYELDTLLTNGDRTLDLTMNGLDNEANNIHGVFYNSNFKARLDFQRYIRRLDHDPLAGFDLSSGTPAANDSIVTRDLNAGDNYAMRIQQMDARFQGRVTDNLKWKLNVWGMRKFGERQVTAVGHCMNINAIPPTTPGTNNKCHVLSQTQTIDWQTMEIEPGLEWRGEAVTFEYRRTMRTFGQNDELTTRNYSRFGYSPTSGTLGPDYLYAYVPENFTQIDRFKVRADLNESNEAYASLYYGDTRNQFRDTHRGMSGADVRLVNRSFDNVTNTAYATWDRQDNQLPSSYFTSAPYGKPTPPSGEGEPTSLEHPVDYDTGKLGLRNNWKPLAARGDFDPVNDPWSGLSLVSGYEYMTIQRDYASYAASATAVFTQPDTKRHQLEIGPNMQWSSTFNTFTRYKARFYEDPILGVREANRRFNTNQPEQEHIIELGGTWSPTSNFMATLQVGLVNRWNQSMYGWDGQPLTSPVRFNDDSYPIITSFYYAATDRLSFNGGYGFFSNWIDQDISIRNGTTPNSETTAWNYDAVNHLVSFNTNYQLTQTVKLFGGYEWNRGNNVFSNPTSTTGANWNLGPGLSSYSDVLVETQRFSTGADWSPYRDTNLFVRYDYFDFNDIASNVGSGTTNMLLTGVTLVR